MQPPWLDLASRGTVFPDHRRAEGIDPADLLACRALLRGGSRSFHAAARLLPRAVRDPAVALYAFCRLADDAIDVAGNPGHALEDLSRRLDRIYADRPLPEPADRALARVVTCYAIPRDLPLALLEGFAWDAEDRRYETLSELRAYAVRVAGSVGMMMALLMGVRDPACLARACDLGVAMQFSNIARDVGEDARNGRLYLPMEWLRDVGLDPQAWLATPEFSPALARVVQRLLSEADALYARADSGIAALPLSCRPGIRAARSLYAGIGEQVARDGYDSLHGRAVLSRRRKLNTLALACVRRHDSAGLRAPALAEAVQLLRSVPPDGIPRIPRHSVRRVPRRPIGARVVWTIELFQRLAERDALG